MVATMASTLATAPTRLALSLALVMGLGPLAGCDGAKSNTGASATPSSGSSAARGGGDGQPIPVDAVGDLEGSIRLVLNDPTGRDGPGAGCEVELCTSLLSLIEGASTSIDFALYGLRNQPLILGALRAAKARGVAVRGVVDRDVEGDNYYSGTEELVALGQVHDDRRADQQLEREFKRDERGKRFGEEPSCVRPEGFAGYVQCLAYDLGERCLLATHASRETFETSEDNTGKAFNKIMHDKYFVVDGRYLWTGSTNISDSGTGGYNANLVLVLDSPTVAGWYTREFETMYGGKHHQQKPKTKDIYDGPLETRVGNATVQVLFSPQDRAISDGVRPLLQAAQERIDIAVFFLTSKAVTKDLIAAHQRGVKVRVILDATAAKNGYTKHELLREVGIAVKVESWGGKMHMKSAAIDGQHLIAGSMNWTSAGEWDNDENTLLIHDPALAEQYHGTFDKLWASIPEQWAHANPDPESRDSKGSCEDGFDNDFDHRADADDPGCGPNPPALPELPPHWVIPKDKITCQHPPKA